MKYGRYNTSGKEMNCRKGYLSYHYTWGIRFSKEIWTFDEIL